MAIELVAHDPGWDVQADILIGDLRAVIGPTATQLTHVGSTSIPGLAAKAKLHVDIVLAPGTSPETLCDQLCPLGYANLGYLHRPGEIQLTRPTGPRFGPEQPAEPTSIMAHRLCLCRHDCTAAEDRRRFRDALRQNPALKNEYERLKLNLVAKLGKIPDWDSYNCGKTGFIEAVLRSAPD